MVYIVKHIRKCNSMLKVNILLFIFATLLIIYCFLHKSIAPSFDHFILKNLNNNDDQDLKFIKLQSECSCRKDVFFVADIQKKVFTCDLYNVLRRGYGQKVVSYSLYGSNPIYYTEIKKISQQVAKYFPDWIIRIHYDDTLNKSIICEYECLKDDVTGKYVDNIDFCNINQIPFGNPLKTWNAQYMHSMKWRFLPIGDPFVDIFMSRDLDSWIIDREVEAVKEWLNSNTLFHIMRGCLRSFIVFFYIFFLICFLITLFRPPST